MKWGSLLFYGTLSVIKRAAIISLKLGGLMYAVGVLAGILEHFLGPAPLILWVIFGLSFLPLAVGLVLLVLSWAVTRYRRTAQPETAKSEAQRLGIELLDRWESLAKENRVKLATQLLSKLQPDVVRSSADDSSLKAQIAQLASTGRVDA